MNEEICCITNWGKLAKNEWENDNSDFIRSYTVIKNNGNYFSTLTG